MEGDPKPTPSDPQKESTPAQGIHRLAGQAAILTGAFLWGLVGVISKQIPLPAFSLAFWRSLLGGLFLLLLLGAKDQKRRITLADLPWLICSGLALAGCWACMFFSIQYGSVSLAILLIYCAPLFVVLLSPFLGEKLTRPALLTCGVIFIGLVLISGQKLFDGPDLRRGAFFGLLSAGFYSLIPLINKKRQGAGGLASTTLQLLTAAFALFVASWLSNTPLTPPKGAPMFWLLVLGVACTGLGMWFYILSLTLLPAQKVALYSYLEPVGALFWSFVFLGERLLPLQIIGAFLTLGAPILLETLRGRSSRKALALGGTVPRPPRRT